ncbi:DUF3291 domain-containing protein [Streptomyces sp. NPDC050738]|uniref:DUF3291 domain-containing protein n=1 Tax=Streptomyces sp. NPDC050738 TaxID=3154744 RepID=UPI00341CF9C1
MPDLPWIVPQAPAPHTEAYAMASRFETRTLLGALRFFAKAPGIMLQIRKAPGAYGVTLRARPLRRTFWTLSVWESKEALYRFAGTGAHRAGVRAVRGLMSDSTFTYWAANTDDVPLGWEEALRRLDEEDEKKQQTQV